LKVRDAELGEMGDETVGMLSADACVRRVELLTGEVEALVSVLSRGPA
jgi:hypothetical protein